eukprot:tig00000157_g9680.t1
MSHLNYRIRDVVYFANVNIILLLELAVSPPYALELPRPPAPALVPIARTGEARPRAPRPAPAPLRPHARRRPSRGSSCGACRGGAGAGAGPPPLSIQYVVRREGRVLFQNRETVAVTCPESPAAAEMLDMLLEAAVAEPAPPAGAKPKRPSGAAAARAGQQRAEAARYVLQRLGAGPGPGPGRGPGPGPGRGRGRGGPRVGDGGAVSPEFRAALAAKCRAILGLAAPGARRRPWTAPPASPRSSTAGASPASRPRCGAGWRRRRGGSGRGAGRGAGRGGGRGARGGADGAGVARAAAGEPGAGAAAGAGAGGPGPGGRGGGEKCAPGGGLLGDLWRSFLCLGDPSQAPGPGPAGPAPRPELTPSKATR